MTYAWTMKTVFENNKFNKTTFFLVWHSLVSRSHGSVPKKLWLCCWWLHSVRYGCDSLDCNECTMLSRDAAMWIFPLSTILPGSKPLFLRSLLLPCVNCVSIVSDHCWHLPTSWCSYPFPSCPFYRCLWSEDEVVLLLVASSLYRRTFRILPSVDLLLVHCCHSEVMLSRVFKPGQGFMRDWQLPMQNIFLHITDVVQGKGRVQYRLALVSLQELPRQS